MTKKTVEGNLLYEAPATDTYECEEYNFDIPVPRGKPGKHIVGHQGPKSYLASEACWGDIYSGRISVIDQACLPCSSRLQCSDPDIYPLNPRKSWNITDPGEVWVDGTIRNISEYCIETSKHNKKLLFCPEEINYKYLTSAIFRKCCPDGQVLDIQSNNKCTFTQNSTDKMEKESTEEDLLYEVPDNKTYECEEYAFEFPVARGKYESNVFGRRGPKSYLVHEACWINIHTGRISVIEQACLTRVDDNKIWFCPKEVDSQPLINRICQCLSMISILVTIILHLIIKDLRCLNFTKLKIPFLVCLFFVNVGFNATKSPVILGLAYQNIFLGFFFWLTSMSVDIWLTFRRISNPLQNRNNEDAVHRMRLYYTTTYFHLGVLLLFPL